MAKLTGVMALTLCAAVLGTAPSVSVKNSMEGRIQDKRQELDSLALAANDVGATIEGVEEEMDSLDQKGQDLDGVIESAERIADSVQLPGPAPKSTAGGSAKLSPEQLQQVAQEIVKLQEAQQQPEVEEQLTPEIWSEVQAALIERRTALETLLTETEQAGVALAQVMQQEQQKRQQRDSIAADYQQLLKDFEEVEQQFREFRTNWFKQVTVEPGKVSADEFNSRKAYVDDRRKAVDAKEAELLKADGELKALSDQREQKSKEHQSLLADCQRQVEDLVRLEAKRQRLVNTRVQQLGTPGWCFSPPVAEPAESEPDKPAEDKPEAK